NRQMSRLVCDVPLDVDPGDLRQGPWDREQVRVLFDQLAFRTLMPRLLEAVGEVAAVAEADTLEVDVAVVRDAKAVVQLLRDIAKTGHPYAIELRWEGLPVTSALRAVGIAYDDRVAYVDGDLLRDPNVRDTLVTITAAGGPPLVAH